MLILGGDSGRPYWERGTSKAVGILSVGVGTEDGEKSAPISRLRIEVRT